MWGRELIKRGTRWRIGNGTDFAVYNHWVHSGFGPKVIAPPVLGIDVLVDSLITNTGGWRVDVVNSCFNEVEAKAILQISGIHHPTGLFGPTTKVARLLLSIATD